MDLGNILAWRYPGTEGGEDYSVQDDGDGPYIAYWNEAKFGPQPTTEQLRSWWLDAEKWSKKGQFRRLADADYESILAPEGNLTLVQRDEILEKKAINAASPGKVTFSNQEKAASDKIDALRTKRADKFREVNAITQGTTETLEDAVRRLRALSW